MALPAALLAVLDLVVTFWGGANIAAFGVSTVSYVSAAFGLTVTLLMVHLGAALGAIALAGRLWSRTIWPWLILAALFGLSWQATIMQGDGIRSHEYFGAIRVAGAIVAPLGLAGFVWLVGFFERIDRERRGMLAAAVASVGTALHFVVLTDYRPFHGHLALFVVACAGWALLPILRTKVARRSGLVMIVVALIATGLGWVERDKVQPHVQLLSHTTASVLKALPLARPFRVEAEPLVAGRAELDDEQLERGRDSFAPKHDALSSPDAYGQNVLLIVIESVRTDYWAEPDLTPKFHRWKERGLYFPRAIAQYPATPLAYGAMFASQPPSVLAQSPFWRNDRLFDDVRPKFDELILTRPQNEWFDHNAITDFFIPSDIAPYGHKDGEDGLEYARGRLEEFDDDDSFFGWVHLYEPHAPYVVRPEFIDGDGNRAAYRSEIAWVDDRLGEFMEWFYDSPYAEDTLVIVIGDHGEAMGDEVFGERFWGHHIHVHEAVNRVPLFVSGPGLPEGAEEGEVQVSQMDVMPTIFDFVGLDIPPESLAQGSSLYSVIDRRPARPIVTEAFSIRGTKFFNFIGRTADGDPEEIAREFHKISTEGSRYSPKIALQYGPHKLVYDRMLRHYWLYDTRSDPAEQHDLSEERPELLETMKVRLDEWALAQSWAIEQLNGRLVD